MDPSWELRFNHRIGKEKPQSFGFVSWGNRAKLENQERGGSCLKKLFILIPGFLVTSCASHQTFNPLINTVTVPGIIEVSGEWIKTRGNKNRPENLKFAE